MEILRLLSIAIFTIVNLPTTHPDYCQPTNRTLYKVFKMLLTEKEWETTWVQLAYKSISEIKTLLVN